MSPHPQPELAAPPLRLLGQSTPHWTGYKEEAADGRSGRSGSKYGGTVSGLHTVLGQGGDGKPRHTSPERVSMDDRPQGYAQCIHC